MLMGERSIKRIRMGLLALCVAAGAQSAQAVELAPTGVGDALVFPIWTTTNQHLTVFSVITHLTRSYFPHIEVRAFKLNVRNAQGEVLFSANVYTRVSTSWNASIVPLPDGRSRLASNPGFGCVLVGEAGQVAPWSGSVDLDASHGYIEAIVMGVPESPVALTGCLPLAHHWNSETGLWSQGQDPNSHMQGTGSRTMRGALTLVNVQKGTSYAIPATALREFSDIAQHTEPSSPLPDLASAHDSGTAEGATRSRVCDANHCEEDSWALPRDAVAAALMASSLRGEFTNSPTLAGKSDLVFTYPLRHHFAEEDQAQLGAAQPHLYTYDRSGMAAGGTVLICPGPNPLACDPPWELDHSESLAVFSLPDSEGEHPEQPSDVLGIAVQSVTALGPAPNEGTFRASYSGGLVSNSGRNYFGVPVIGVALQQFENGNLTGEDGVPQRANYGVAVPMTRTVP